MNLYQSNQDLLVPPLGLTSRQQMYTFWSDYKTYDPLRRFNYQMRGVVHDLARVRWCYYQGNRPIPRWRLWIIQRENEKSIGTLISFFRSFISFFRSFISFFRTFISALRGEFSFAPWSFPISSGGTGISGDVRVAMECGYSAVLWWLIRTFVSNHEWIHLKGDNT